MTMKCFLRLGQIPLWSSSLYSCFGNLPSSVLTRCPTERIWLRMIYISMRGTLACCSTVVYGVNDFHPMFNILLRHLWWNLSKVLMCRQYVVFISEKYMSIERTHDSYTLICPTIHVSRVHQRPCWLVRSWELFLNQRFRPRIERCQDKQTIQPPPTCSPWCRVPHIADRLVQWASP